MYIVQHKNKIVVGRIIDVCCLIYLNKIRAIYIIYYLNIQGCGVLFILNISKNLTSCNLYP